MYVVYVAAFKPAAPLLAHPTTMMSWIEAWKDSDHGRYPHSQVDGCATGLLLADGPSSAGRVSSGHADAWTRSRGRRRRRRRRPSDHGSSPSRRRHRPRRSARSVRSTQFVPRRRAADPASSTNAFRRSTPPFSRGRRLAPTPAAAECALSSMQLSADHKLRAIARAERDARHRHRTGSPTIWITGLASTPPPLALPQAVSTARDHGLALHQPCLRSWLSSMGPASPLRTACRCTTRNVLTSKAARLRVDRCLRIRAPTCDGKSAPAAL